MATAADQRRDILIGTAGQRPGRNQINESTHGSCRRVKALWRKGFQSSRKLLNQMKRRPHRDPGAAGLDAPIRGNRDSFLGVFADTPPHMYNLTSLLR